MSRNKLMVTVVNQNDQRQHSDVRFAIPVSQVMHYVNLLTKDSSDACLRVDGQCIKHVFVGNGMHVSYDSDMLGDSYASDIIETNSISDDQFMELVQAPSHYSYLVTEHSEADLMRYPLQTFDDLDDAVAFCDALNKKNTDNETSFEVETLRHNSRHCRCTL